MSEAHLNDSVSSLPFRADGGPRRRLLMTTDTVGGVWTYGIDLAEALSREGADVTLAAIGPSLSDQQAREAAALPGVELEFFEADLEWMPDPWADVERTRLWLSDLERRIQPDWIQLNQYCYTTAGFVAPTLVVGHSCVYSWFAAVKQSEPGEEWTRYRQTVGEGLAAAGGVTAVSEALLDELSRHYGPFHRLPAIRNGRDLRGLSPGPKDPYILSAGRVWDEAKNILLLDQIASEVAWPIRIAGDAQAPDGGAAQVVDRLELLGLQEGEAMADLFRRAPIYAAPALYEPFGLAILEAAAAGAALALADIPSLKANWEGAALFLPPCNPQAWRNGLTQLIEDEAVREHLGDLARQRATSSDFSTLRMARGYLALYDTLRVPTLAEGDNKIA